ncbi:MAG: hypothetical protein JWM48_862 [Mycobacterium sp.]|nr:hypothetical protein [Mycobacterium sp.]
MRTSLGGMTAATPADAALPALAPGALLARKAHRTLEMLHASSYFVPESQAAFEPLGVRGGMRSYVAARSAALGVVPGPVVTATFFNFAPRVIERYVPAVWAITTPEAVTAARLAMVDAAWRRLLGDDVVGSAEMAEAAALARRATEALTPQGKPLYAAHAAQPWPEPVHLQLFWAQTLLREHRGDIHIAALVCEGVGPLDALVTYAAQGDGLPESVLRATRGWDDAEWEATQQRLRAAGLLGDGGLTPAGVAQRERLEWVTDTRSAAPWEHIGEADTARLRELARPWSKTLGSALLR